MKQELKEARKDVHRHIVTKEKHEKYVNQDRIEWKLNFCTNGVQVAFPNRCHNTLLIM
jgi:hypothetical protein